MPNAKVLEQKQAIVDELAQKIESAAAGVFVDYRGLTVEEDTKLRAAMRQEGIEYKVVKNTLTRFAVNKIGMTGLDEILNGPTSLAISQDDPAARVISKFAKEYEALEIKSGFVDGKVISISEIKDLADLPSREVLVAKALGGLNAPISGFANVLNANLRGLVIALNAIAEKQSA